MYSLSSCSFLFQFKALYDLLLNTNICSHSLLVSILLCITMFYVCNVCYRFLCVTHSPIEHYAFSQHFIIYVLTSKTEYLLFTKTLLELNQTMQCETLKNEKQDELRSHVLLFDTIIHVYVFVLFCFYYYLLSFIRSFVLAESDTHIYKRSPSVRLLKLFSFFGTHKKRMFLYMHLCV